MVNPWDVISTFWQWTVVCQLGCFSNLVKFSWLHCDCNKHGRPGRRVSNKLVNSERENWDKSTFNLCKFTPTTTKCNYMNFPRFGLQLLAGGWVSQCVPCDTINDMSCLSSDRFWSYTSKKSQDKVKSWKPKAWTNCHVLRSIYYYQELNRHTRNWYVHHYKLDALLPTTRT